MLNRRFLSVISNLLAGPGRSIWIPILLGLAIRELLSPFTGHPFDFELWIRLGFYTTRGQDPYTATAPVPGLSFPGAGEMTWIGYPPLWPFIQAGIYAIYTFIGFSNRFFYYFLVKQPMVLGDILAGYLIFRIVELEGQNRGKAMRAMSFWLLCPFTIIISSVWGMFDQIVLDLVLVSMLFISRTVKSSLLEALGIFLKAIPLIFVPLFSLSQDNIKKFIVYALVSVGIAALLSLAPYFIFRSWNLQNVEGVGLDVTNKIGNSENYWVVISVLNNYGLVPSNYFQIFRWIGYLWIPAILLGSLYCAYRFRGWTVSTRRGKSVSRARTSLQGTSLYISALFVVLIFLLVRPTINEQYTIYFIGIGLLDVSLIGRKRFWNFNLVWLSALGYLLANNVYLIRFLEPLSINYLRVEQSLQQGFDGEIRNGLLVVFGLLFSVSALLYLRSIYMEIRNGGVAFEKKVAVSN